MVSAIAVALSLSLCQPHSPSASTHLLIILASWGTDSSFSLLQDRERAEVLPGEAVCPVTHIRKKQSWLLHLFGPSSHLRNQSALLPLKWSSCLLGLMAKYLFRRKPFGLFSQPVEMLIGRYVYTSFLLWTEDPVYLLPGSRNQVIMNEAHSGSYFYMWPVWFQKTLYEVAFFIFSGEHLISARLDLWSWGCILW